MKETAHATWVELLRRLAPLLPSELFDRLRASPYPSALSARGQGRSKVQRRALAGDLQQAIYTLDSLHHTLTNFLPRYLLDLSPTPGKPHGELLEGSFIFADVTGFTALTGELSKQGTEGLEEMNRLMNALFGALLDPLLTSGGDLLMFAGDAALACFPAQPDWPEGREARWATRTALRLVEAIADFAHIQTPYGDFSLTMSAGVERGRAFAAVVGTRKRMELLISGGPVQGAMRAEGEAEPGQVFVGPGIRPSLSPKEFIMRGAVVEGIPGGELGDYEAIPPSRRRSRMSTILSRRVPDLIEHLQQVLDQVERLLPFISPDLFIQFVRGEDIRQHPPVTIQFVNIIGLEDIALGPAGPKQATAILQRYFVQAQEIVTDREGIINKLDPYAQGCFLLNPFGAPVYHEGAPRLAASTALELGRALERVNQEFDLKPPLVQRTGLTHDRIFTGELGYRQRREYVVAGPAVNLAARLMGKAEAGQIVLDPTAWEAVRRDFRADALSPILLKGIPEPVPRFALQGLGRGKGFHLADYPLTGRQEQLSALEERLRQAVVGQGQALALVGEAGVGKSRLADRLIDSARRQGMTVLTGRCHPFARTTPYFPWKDLLSRWFELDEDMPLKARRQRLRKQLAQFDLTLSLPAFADLLGLSPIDLASRVAQTETNLAKSVDGLFAALRQRTGQLAEQQTKPEQASNQGWALLAKRATQVETTQAESDRPSLWEILRERAFFPQALHLALERQALRQPTLLVVEDIQWIDGESRRILDELVAAIPSWPLFLLATTRPETDWWTGDRFPLPPLSDEDSRELAALALQATWLNRELADWLIARVGGNPLFILSYCRALQDADAVVVDPVSGEARRSGPPPPLPLPLQELLLAQVDRLGQEVREAMRRGAIIGDTFPTWLLARICHETLFPGQLDQALDQASRRGLIIPPPPSQAHAFSSQSLHDAIYATLPHALRRDWHRQVGDQLAKAKAATRYECLEQIAYHYSHSNDSYKAARFTRLAGDKARTHQADEAALAFYAQVLAVTDGDEDRDRERIAVEQRRAHEGIGDVHAMRGAREEATTAYQAALQGAPSKDGHRLEAKLALLAPLGGVMDMKPLEEAQKALSSSDPLQPWMGAALVWLRAGGSELETAAALCRELLLTVSEPVRTLLQESLESLERGEPLPPYADLFALFAYSYLRLPPE